MNPFSPDAALEIRRLREWMPDRRERIAAAVLQGLLADPSGHATINGYVVGAVALADALIAELDKPKEVQP